MYVIIFLFCVAFTFFFYASCKNVCKKRLIGTGGSAKSIAVIVLGDIGRSPRMQQHVLELRRRYAPEQVQLFFIGTEGTPCREELETHPGVTLCRLKAPLVDVLGSHWMLQWTIGKLVFAFLRVMDQSLQLVSVLLSLSSLRCVLVQNPPSVPTLPILWALKWMKGYFLVVDWHNYGWSILALSPTWKCLVPLYRWIEQTFGAKADAAFCVSKAMETNLVSQWGIPSDRLAVLYDRPPSTFRPLAENEKQAFLASYFRGTLPEHPAPVQELDKKHTPRSDSLCWFTSKEEQRPVLLVTATSWTPDEDLHLLLRVLIRYNTAASQLSLPRVVMIITGKGGDCQAQWIEEANRVQWSHVYIFTAFLPYSDYWKLLACADLGICLHTSSSGTPKCSSPSVCEYLRKCIVCTGLDLPMKAVDMRGVGTPILAAQFPTLHEVVEKGISGDTFLSEEDLYERLRYYLQQPPDAETGALYALRRKARSHCVTESWSETWHTVAFPIICGFLKD